MNKKTRILVLGITGMLGSTVFRSLSTDEELEVYGTLRESADLQFFSSKIQERILYGICPEGESGLLKSFSFSRPDVVINCIGIIKQRPDAADHLQSLEINSTLPHRLANYCNMFGSRLIHFSTDCVFSGKQGGYIEGDFPDANDLYGRSKLLGEVGYGNAITLRTSIIGHELKSNKSLVDWFLSQKSNVSGYTRAVFSGLPATEIARILKDIVIPDAELKGLYHLSVEPITKFNLLNIVAKQYSKNVTIVADDTVVVDRSLSSDRFRQRTGFVPKSWEVLVSEMHDYYLRYFD